MENQHRKIKGYRELNQNEIDLMNKAKNLESQCLALYDEIGNQLRLQHEIGNQESVERLHDSRATVWLESGRGGIEAGFMFFIRAIAQPQTKG